MLFVHNRLPNEFLAAFCRSFDSLSKLASISGSNVYSECVFRMCIPKARKLIT